MQSKQSTVFPHLSSLRNDLRLEAFQQPSFPNQLVEQPFPFHERRRRIELCDRTVIENDDAVGVEDGVDAMRDGDDGAILEGLAPQSGL